MALVFVTRAYLLPDPHFVGRKPLMDKIAAQLRAEYRLVLFGSHGVGKTALARQYAELYHSDYKNILWVPAFGSLPLNFQGLGLNAG